MTEVGKSFQDPKQLTLDELKKCYPEFSQLLLERQAEVAQRESQALAQLDEQIPSGPGDVGDESVIDTSADYFLTLANAQKKELVEIRNALARMRCGSYGVCESCSDPISLERLRQLPYARLCIDCQAAAERQIRTVRTA